MKNINNPPIQRKSKGSNPDVLAAQLAERAKQIAYVESFPKQGSETDDTARIQRAIDSIKTTGGLVQFAGITYTISSPLKVYTNISIKGINREQTKIDTQGDIPAFASEGYFTTGVGNSDVRIENIGIFPSNVTTKTKYAIELVNTFNCFINNIKISGLTLTQTDVEGIRFSKDSTYTGNHFINSVERSQLSNASIVMQSTDGYIFKNEIWGHTRSFAIHIQKSEQFIISNQIVGSSVNGGLWVKDDIDNFDVELLKIEGNYFDGSYDTVDSGLGLNAVNMRTSNVIGNNFWRQMDEGIKFDTCHSNTISGNTFSDNNRRNASKDDIYFVNNCAANIVISNTHKQTVNQTNKGMAIHTVNSPADGNHIIGNIVYFISNFNTSVISANDTTTSNYGTIPNGNTFSSVVAAFPSSPTITTGAQTRADFNQFTTDKLGEMTTGKFTAKRTGVYDISSAIAWQGQSANNRTLLLVYKNGVELRRIYDGNSALSWSTASGSMTVSLNTGDYIEIYYYTSGTATVDITKSYLTIDRIS